MADWIAHRPEVADRGNVDVRLITQKGVERRKADELEALLDGPGLLWIDVAHWDAETERILGKRLELHPRAMHDCAVRNPVPKVHLYPGQTFLVLHAPQRGARGHVHYIERGLLTLVLDADSLRSL